MCVHVYAVCMFVQVHIYMHMSMCVHYICVCRCACMHACVYVYAGYMYVQMYINAHECVYALYICACVHVYTDVHAVYYICVSVNCSLGVILFFFGDSSLTCSADWSKILVWSRKTLNSQR